MPDLFDYAAAQKNRDEATGRVDENASEAFKDVAYRAVLQTAARCGTFIVDDVWASMPLDCETHDKRAMGAVILRAVRAGKIEKTEHFRPSSQPQCHANPRRVWRSMCDQFNQGEF